VSAHITEAAASSQAKHRAVFGDPGSPGAVPGELSVEARITVCAL